MLNNENGPQNEDTAWEKGYKEEERSQKWQSRVDKTKKKKCV